MIFFLYGPDDYRRLRRKQELFRELKKKYPELTAERFDLATIEGGAGFEGFAKGQSLFSEKRLAILEGVYELESKSAKELFEPLVERKDLAVIISEKEKPLKTIEFLAKLPTAEKFEHLAGAEWLSCARKLAKEEGAEFTPGALRLLSGLYEKNSFGLATELEKLSALGKTIEEKDVEGLGLEKAVEYWPLLNSLKSANLGARLWALKKLSDQNEQAAKTFNILSAGNKQKAAEFAAYDLLIKSGKLDYEEALLALAIA